MLRPVHVAATLLGCIGMALVFWRSDGRGAAVDESTIFANRVRAVRDAAVVDGRPTRLWLDREGYGFEERSGRRWLPMTEPGLRPVRWRPSIGVVVPGASGRVSVVFAPAGTADRSMTLAFTHARDVLHVAIAPSGAVRTD